MTNYKITFERDNGTIGQDTFVANNKHEAIKAFEDCYRHGKYGIISVEPFETFENDFMNG